MSDDFRSDMGVLLIDSMGDDNTICNSARVSTGSDMVGYKESAGLINYLWREGHTSPFEHVAVTMRLDIPIFIARQVMTHRTFSFNEVSGRYSELDLNFWLPERDRPLHNSGSGAYPQLEITDNQEELALETETSLIKVCEQALIEYNHLLAKGVATEVARAVLPVNFYTQIWMSGNLKNWFDFVAKRTVPNAQQEIQEVATQALQLLRTVAPLATEAFYNHTFKKQESK